MGKFFATLKKNWQKLRKLQKTAIIVAIAFLIVIGAGVWYYSAVIANPKVTLGPKNIPQKTEEVTGSHNSNDDLNQWKAEDYYDSNIVNFVLLGFDTDDERRDMDGEGWGKGFAGARPDSIRVISINLDTYTSAVVSIPRDTYVRIANTNGKDKINASYMYGRLAAHQQGITDEEEIDKMGLDYVMQTISNVFGGVPMNYYMAIDFDTVINFVDAIGGVKYDVDIEVKDENGNLMLEKGPQVLNGTQAYIYLQDRQHTPGGDMGRTEHHTLFLKTMMKQLVDNAKLMDALKFLIYDNNMGNIETNMTVDQIMSAGYIAKELNLTDINPYTLECRNDMMDGIAYVVMDQEKRSELIKKVFDYDYPVQPEENLVDTVPNPPVNFSAAAGDTGITLSWEAGDIHNLAYNIWRDGTQVATNVTETTYLDTGATGQITYAIQAVNGDAVSAKVSATAQAGGAATCEVSNFQGTFDAATNTVHLTWNCNDSHVSFTLYKSEGGDDGRQMDRRITAHGYDDNSVAQNTTYTYRLVTVNSDGTECGELSCQVNTGESESPAQ